MATTTAGEKQTLNFETEVKQLLHLVIHSLYSNKEIFLRELISNASDAADKLRFEALANDGLYQNDSDLKVTVDIDQKARTITIEDNGIGMNRDDVVQHIGTIAKSGTREFLNKMSDEKTKDANFIGQFGVGFYSAFIIADKVTLETRRAGVKEDQAVRWESEGTGEYSIEMIEKKDRGTKITLHLKADEDEFLEPWRLRSIINKYSDHIPLPVLMLKEAFPLPGEEENKEKEEVIPEYEKVNQATALWTLPRSSIKDEDYSAFYKHIGHDFDDPLTWSHNKVEGKQQYTTLLYIPKRAPFDLWQRDYTRGLRLYVQRVFIMDNAEQFLPHYLRFIKGVVDSSDLPLNVSREILQSNRVVDTIRGAIVKRVLSMLEQLATQEKEKFSSFWKEFGQVLKEGPAEDFANRERIAKLLRFATTHSDSNEQTVSLEEYVSRMKSGQTKIYYITADNIGAARHSPHLEIFKNKGIEVLLLTDRIDEWLVGNLTEFDGKQLQSVAKGELDLGEVEDASEKEQQKKIEDESQELTQRVKDVLGDAVKEVRVTHRLTDSPACIVADDNDIGAHMHRILKAAGQDVPTAKPILELNPTHPLVITLKKEQGERFNELSHILLDQSVLAEGGQLDDPAQFIKRLNKFLLEIASRA